VLDATVPAGVPGSFLDHAFRLPNGSAWMPATSWSRSVGGQEDLLLEVAARLAQAERTGGRAELRLWSATAPEYTLSRGVGAVRLRLSDRGGV